MANESKKKRGSKAPPALPAMTGDAEGNAARAAGPPVDADRDPSHVVALDRDAVSSFRPADGNQGPQAETLTSRLAAGPPPLPATDAAGSAVRSDPDAGSGADGADPAPAAASVTPLRQPHDKQFAALADDGQADAPAAASDEAEAPARRAARRRPAGPSRGRIAANDDAPSIGGLIYALEQKPSDKPFRYAAVASGLWTVLWLTFATVMVFPHIRDGAGLLDVLVRSNAMLIAAAIFVPVSLFWFLAALAWRTEELKLRSSTMTEVAIRLAEPDRMAEQSVASLGQAVRRQVSFMNDAVSRALGRAGELEALVHGEVSALERSYEENERKIRGLIQELAGERHALLNTSERVSSTLQSMGTEIPALIEKLADQQLKLATIIDGAGQNLTSLESAITDTSRQLASTVDTSALRLQSAVSETAEQFVSTIDTSTQRLESSMTETAHRLTSTVEESANTLDGRISTSADRLEETLGDHTTRLQAVLEDYTSALGSALDSRSQQMQDTFSSHSQLIEESLGTRTERLEHVFDEYAQALDDSMANRTQALDVQLVERTRALDDAFSERLKLFDESILRSTMAIDGAITERSAALSTAMEEHARTMSEIVGKQATELDETLMHGIAAVRRSSESITRQSLKAIEGLASQSDMLKNISENLLGQIHTVTGRFEEQGSTIMKAASTLENVNYRIDSTLQTRHAELSRTLDKLSGKAEELGEFLQGYSTSIEGSISDVEQRARLLTEGIARETQDRSQAALAEIERLRSSTDTETRRALEDLRTRFSSVETEMSNQLGTLTNRFDVTSEQVREQTARAAAALEQEQSRLRQQIDQLPHTTQAGAEAMRRSLQDQLRALDQLSTLANREGRRRDIAAPVPLQAADIHPAELEQPVAPMPHPTAAAPAQHGRSLSSLTAGLGKELATRQQTHAHQQPQPAAHMHPPAAQRQPQQPVQPPQAQFQPQSQQPAPRAQAPAAQSAAGNGRDAWSLGDLLARASVDDERDGAEGEGSHGSAAILDVAEIANALDAATASAIWSRLRAGQRGVMVRSIYPSSGRETFDEVSRRYAADSGFQATVNRFLGDFERILREIEQKDTTGRTAQNYAVSETGRVYLFLAHASGRLT